MSVYTDQTHSSQDESVERRSAGGGHLGARILVQPEPNARLTDVRYSPVKSRLPSESINSTTIRLHNATADKGAPEAPSVYARQIAGSQIQQSTEIPIVHKRVASLHSKTTGQPATHAASKRLSQKSSKNQFHMAGGNQV